MTNKKRLFIDLLKQRPPATLIGVIVLGVIGTMLYDLAVKPGLSSVGRVILEITTLGSSTLRDSAYSSAALDPTPITPLILLIALISALMLPVWYVVVSFFMPKLKTSRQIRELEQALEAATQDDKKDISHKFDALRGRLRRQLAYIVVVYVVCLVLPMYVAFTVHNQSIAIWRSFNADVSLLRPHITPQQYYELCARFSAVGKRSDYVALRKVMEDMANRSNVRLHNIAVW